MHNTVYIHHLTHLHAVQSIIDPTAASEDAFMQSIATNDPIETYQPPMRPLVHRQSSIQTGKCYICMVVVVYVHDSSGSGGGIHVWW